MAQSAMASAVEDYAIPISVCQRSGDMPDQLPKLRFRDWLSFWRENMSQSYTAASDHHNLASFIGSIITAILGVIGVSALTTNKTLSALGAGLGLVAWFMFLALFVTPARMWIQRRVGDATSFTPADRPRVKLSASMRERVSGTWVTEIQADNFSDTAAMNVSAEVSFPGTLYQLRIRFISRLVKGSPEHFAPELLYDGKPWGICLPAEVMDARRRVTKHLAEGIHC
jgi:hypothetical protein